jgi:regulator of sigma E protease
LTVTPDATPPRLDPFASNQVLDVPGLGLCYQVEPRVNSVVADSPAARAGIKPGDVINAMSIPPEEPASGEKKPDAKRQEFKFDADPTWIKAFVALQTQRPRAIRLTLNKSPKVVEIQPAAAPDWFDPSRGLYFSYLFKTVPPRDFAGAVQAGLGKTYSDVLDIYTMLRGLFQQRIGPTNLGGPITIAQIAYKAAGHGWTDLIGFLGMMSINLAVLNFLPIPPLDGGQMTFLLIEKVRGRPLPESVLIGAIYIGLPLVLLIMVFVTYQDVFRIIKDLLH